MNTNVKNIHFQVGLNHCWIAFATLAFVVLWLAPLTSPQPEMAAT